MEIITTTDALGALCTALENDEFVTVDTEFMRERTFYPQLCLIQIAGKEREAIIDPLSNELSLEPFYQLMANEAVLKVFHAARQDLEIIYIQSARMPKPLFDSQIAAMVCGFGDQIGYEALVRRLANVQIDKSSRFTDWSRRPLSDKQLSYALSDVTHLRVVYQSLKTKLDDSGRESWLAEEMAILCAPETYQNPPEHAWKKIKFRPRNKRQLGIFMEVAAWREAQAQQRNLPRNRVIKDDALVELATQAPTKPEHMEKLRAVPRGFANSRHGNGLLAAVKAGINRDSDTVPSINHNRPPIPEGSGAIADILKLALKIIAEKEGIAPRLIANSADIERLAAGLGDDLPINKGWRHEVFGTVAAGLTNGSMAIGLKNGRTAIFQVK